MSLSRRHTLSLALGGILLAGSGAAAGFLSTRTPTTALAPWWAAGRFGDPRLDALSWAILAPSPHNRQPWAIRLVGTNRIEIYQDTSRRLPETDPLDRQIMIGIGCFVETLVVAAAQAGIGVAVSVVADAADHLLVTADFHSGMADPDPLFAAIPHRRSCKEPFADRPLSAVDCAVLAPYGRLVTDDAEVAALRALTWKAWQVESQTERTRLESVDLMRFGRHEIEAHPDGIALGGPVLESLMLAGILHREGQRDRSTSGFQLAQERLQTILMATPAYAVLVSDSNRRQDQIDAGRRWLRLNLAATACGVALHPVSQCLQEFPEMVPYYRQAHQMLAAPGQTVQMLGRIGYGPQVPPTPRWPLNSRLLNA